MHLLLSIYETFMTYDDDRGGWHPQSSHTSGTLGVDNNTVMTLTQFNQRIADYGHPQLTTKTLADGVWSCHDDDGVDRFCYSYVGNADCTADPDGKYLYDISLLFNKIEEKPVTKAELLGA